MAPDERLPADDEVDEAIRRRFDSFVEPTDTSRVLAEVDARRASVTEVGRSRRRLGVTIGLAAAALVAVVVAAVAFQGTSDRRLATIDGPPTTAAACADPWWYLYVLPGDFLTRVVEHPMSALGQFSLETAEPPLTPEQFSARFGDDDGYTDHVPAGDAPWTYRAVPGSPVDDGVLDEIRGLEGVLAFDLGGCDGASQSSPPTTTPTEWPGVGVSDQIEQRVGEVPETLPIPEEHAVPVADESGVRVGFADRRDLFPEDRVDAVRGCLEPALVVDDEDRVVGFMFRDYGFVSREAALTGDFSIRDLRVERYGNDLPVTCVQLPGNGP